nr:LOB domain-containing protein 36-like [Tanacetum cinerariifolium]
MSSSSKSPCAAGRYLCRKCTQACVFAAYFPLDQPAKFANVHNVLGVSRVAKILDTLSTSQREDALNSLAFEADAHLKDPVYGSASLIRVLQHSLNPAQDDFHSANQKTQPQYASMQPLMGRIGQVRGPGTPSNMLLGPQQQHLYKAQLVDVSDVGFAPLASLNEVFIPIFLHYF